MRLERTRAEPAKRWMSAMRIVVPTVLLALFLTATTGYSFTALYVFGDSLSDTGRNPAPAPSYFNGRWCNGPVWVEYLSAQLGLPYNASNNFAVAGSTTSNLLSQIDALPASTNLRSGLVTILSGGNDFLDSAGLGVNDAGWNWVISNAVLNLTNAIGTLYTNGAREMIIGNLPNLGQTPAFVGTPTGYSNYVDSKVAVFNTMLASSVSNVMQRDSGLRLYLADNNTFFSRILSAPAAYGFTVSTIGALEDTNLTDKSFTGPGANYIFWDSIHPTTKFDVLTAALAFQNIAVELNIVRTGTNLNLMLVNLYPGLPYTVQSSTNFVTWSNYNTLTATNTNATVALTNGPGSKAFYRVVY